METLHYSPRIKFAKKLLLQIPLQKIYACRQFICSGAVMARTIQAVPTTLKRDLRGILRVVFNIPDPGFLSNW